VAIGHRRHCKQVLAQIARKARCDIHLGTFIIPALIEAQNTSANLNNYSTYKNRPSLAGNHDMFAAASLLQPH